MLEITPLTNYKQFIDLTQQFDNAHDTTTYVTKLTLSAINHTFFQRDLYYAMDKLISRVFLNSPVIYSDDEDIAADDRSKFYSFYHIVNDLRNGVGLLHPINLHYFGDTKVAMHPGNTRLHFMHQYTNQLEVILTDYTGNLKSDHTQLDLQTVEDSFFNLHGLSFLTSVAAQTGPRSIYNAAGGPVRYKECKHVPTANTWGLATNPSPVLQYELNNDMIFVNGAKIMYRHNEKWQFHIA
jgi:hypothetical protein